MRVSALERILLTDRVPRRATMYGDFARAMLHERAVSTEDGPYLVSNARGTFVQTRRRPDGTIWAGFSEVPLGTEAKFTRELFSALWRLSAASGWNNRCTSLSEAVSQMQSFGLEPRSVVVPTTLLKEVCGEELHANDAEKLMLGQGYVAKVGEVRVQAADLLDGAAMVLASPSLLGTYTRSDEYLALMLFRVDRAVVLVGPTAREGLHGVA